MRNNCLSVLIFILLFSSSTSIVFSQEYLYKKQQLPKISYKINSREWHNRNSHLIPSQQDMEAILSLSQERDFKSRDADKDGVANNLDPSPFDWREIGYQPFGVLEFLSWRHEWNNFKYSDEDLKKIVELLKEAGVSFVRMDFLWEDIEPQNNTFDFAKYDFIVDLLSQKNIRILGIMGYSVSWAGENWNNPPRNSADFVDFVSSVVSRYKDKIKYWEIWNEPDSRTYWQAQDDMKTYTNLLKEVYAVAKKIDPTCKILLGGMTSQGYYAIKNVYRNGGKDYFDIINIHPFVDPLNTQEFKRIYAIYNNLERLKQEYDDEDKKIWFTEIGCPGVGGDIESKGWWVGKSPSEKQQAQFLYSIYTDVLKLPNLEKVFWAFFRDNKDHFKDDVDYFGIVRWDFSKKPAYNVYRERYNTWLNLHSELKSSKKYGK